MGGAPQLSPTQVERPVSTGWDSSRNADFYGLHVLLEPMRVGGLGPGREGVGVKGTRTSD